MSSLFSLFHESTPGIAAGAGAVTSGTSTAAAPSVGFAQLVTNESNAKPAPSAVMAAPGADYSHFYAFPPGGDALLSAADELLPHISPAQNVTIATQAHATKPASEALPNASPAQNVTIATQVHATKPASEALPNASPAQNVTIATQVHATKPASEALPHISPTQNVTIATQAHATKPASEALPHISPAQNVTIATQAHATKPASGAQVGEIFSQVAAPRAANAEISSAAHVQGEKFSFHEGPLNVTPSPNESTTAEDDLPWKTPAVKTAFAALTQTIDAAPSPFRREHALPEIHPAAAQLPAAEQNGTAFAPFVADAPLKAVNERTSVAIAPRDAAPDTHPLVAVSSSAPKDPLLRTTSQTLPILKGDLSDAAVTSPAPVIIPHALASKHDVRPPSVPSPFAKPLNVPPSLQTADSPPEAAPQLASFSNHAFHAAPYAGGAFLKDPSGPQAAPVMPQQEQEAAPVTLKADETPADTKPKAPMQAAPSPLRSERRLPDIEANLDPLLPPALPEALTELLHHFPLGRQAAVEKAVIEKTDANAVVTGHEGVALADTLPAPILQAEPHLHGSAQTPPQTQPATPRAVLTPTDQPATHPTTEKTAAATPKASVPHTPEAPASLEHTPPSLMPSVPTPTLKPADSARPLPVPQPRSGRLTHAALPEAAEQGQDPLPAFLRAEAFTPSAQPEAEAVPLASLVAQNQDRVIAPQAPQKATPEREAPEKYTSDVTAPLPPTAAPNAKGTEPAATALANEAQPEADVFTHLLRKAAAFVAGSGVSVANAAEPVAQALTQSAVQTARTAAAAPAALVKNAAAPLTSPSETTAPSTPSLTLPQTPAVPLRKESDSSEATEADIRRLAEALPQAERTIARAAEQHGGFDALAAVIPDPAERAKLTRYAAFLKQHASEESTPSDPKETQGEQERADVTETARSAVDAAAALERLGLTDAHPDRARLQTAAQPADEGRGKAMLASAGESAINVRLQPEPAKTAPAKKEQETSDLTPATKGEPAQASPAEAALPQTLQTPQTPEVIVAAPPPRVLSETIQSTFQRHPPEKPAQPDPDAVAVHETIRQASTSASLDEVRTPASPAPKTGTDLTPQSFKPTEIARPFDIAVNTAKPMDIAVNTNTAETTPAAEKPIAALLLQPKVSRPLTTAATSDETVPAMHNEQTEEPSNVMPAPMPQEAPAAKVAVRDATTPILPDAAPTAPHVTSRMAPAQPQDRQTPVAPALNDAEQAEALPALFKSVFTDGDTSDKGAQHDKGDQPDNGNHETSERPQAASHIEEEPPFFAAIPTETRHAETKATQEAPALVKPLTASATEESNTTNPLPTKGASATEESNTTNPLPTKRASATEESNTTNPLPTKGASATEESNTTNPLPTKRASATEESNTMNPLPTKGASATEESNTTNPLPTKGASATEESNTTNPLPTKGASPTDMPKKHVSGGMKKTQEAAQEAPPSNPAPLSKASDEVTAPVRMAAKTDPSADDAALAPSAKIGAPQPLTEGRPAHPQPQTQSPENDLTPPPTRRNTAKAAKPERTASSKASKDIPAPSVVKAGPEETTSAATVIPAPTGVVTKAAAPTIATSNDTQVKATRQVQQPATPTITTGDDAQAQAKAEATPSVDKPTTPTITTGDDAQAQAKAEATPSVAEPAEANVITGDDTQAKATRKAQQPAESTLSTNNDTQAQVKVEATPSVDKPTTPTITTGDDAQAQAKVETTPSVDKPTTPTITTGDDAQAQAKVETTPSVDKPTTPTITTGDDAQAQASHKAQEPAVSTVTKGDDTKAQATHKAQEPAASTETTDNDTQTQVKAETTPSVAEPAARPPEAAAPHAAPHATAAAHPAAEGMTSARTETAPRTETPAGSAFSASAAPSTADAYDANGAPTVYDQIRFQLAAGKLGEGGKLRMQLRPAELGKVDIRMERKNGKPSVTISAEKPETLDLLQRSEEALSAFVREAFKSDSEKPQIFFAEHGKQGTGGSGGHAGDGQERRPGRETHAGVEPHGAAAAGDAPDPFVPVSDADSMINLKV